MRLNVIAIVGCLAMISCTKGNNSNSIITGKWEVRQSIGGIAGVIQYEPGQGTRYQFSADNTFVMTQYSPGAGAASGTYALKMSSRPGDWLLTLSSVNPQTGNTYSMTDSIRFDKNQLIILPFASCCDIPSTVLERVVL